MDTLNSTQKNIIKLLTETHQDPAKAFKQARAQAKTQSQADTVERIAQALKVDLEPLTMETLTKDGARLKIEIDKTRGASGWLIVTQYGKDGTTHSRDSITGEEFAEIWEQEQKKRNKITTTPTRPRPKGGTVKDFKA